MPTQAATSLAVDDQQLLQTLRALTDGDFSVRMPTGESGSAGEIATTVNELAAMLCLLAPEITRITRVELGTEGIFGGQAEVAGASGAWKTMVDDVNWTGANLTWQFRDIARTVTSIANGHLMKKVDVECRGEVLALKHTLNVFVERLNAFASDVTRLAREVGTEGKFGGQAEVAGLNGTWQDLLDNLNDMSANLTCQMRDFARVTHLASQGDFSQRVTVECRGETEALKADLNAVLESRRGPVPNDSPGDKTFLDNMSRELRTPLNSMLILAKLLADNAEGNLTPKQIKFATTIYDSGSDLLALINEILELSRQAAAGEAEA